ncbi:hypothetical protein E2C01_098005 [Portunus trituberculatus]|uniref:Uncharacterized protein n=1 Tax=Portunus trituberculatus TaxID=210409 RepID=A0A5B7KCW1_PORTR|nr:hypothetical protein [Portunus trituberculatus]
MDATPMRNNGRHHRGRCHSGLGTPVLGGEAGAVAIFLLSPTSHRCSRVVIRVTATYCMTING